MHPARKPKADRWFARHAARSPNLNAIVGAVSLPGAASAARDITQRLREDVASLTPVGARAVANQRNLRRLTSTVPADRTGYVRVGTRMVLVPEVHPPGAVYPDSGNPVDSTAVAVHIAGLEVGHLKREAGEAYHAGLLRLLNDHGRYVCVTCTIAGNGMVLRSNGRWEPADWLNVDALGVYLGGKKGTAPEVREIPRRSYATAYTVSMMGTAIAPPTRIPKPSPPRKQRTPIEPAGRDAGEFLARLDADVQLRIVGDDDASDEPDVVLDSAPDVWVLAMPPDDLAGSL